MGISGRTFNIRQFLYLFFLVFILSASASVAQPFVVSNTNDSGEGSLRQAVINANNNPGVDEIVFDIDLPATITLTTGEITITDSLTISGPRADLLTIDPEGNSRVFLIEFSETEDVEVTIRGIRFINGRSTNGGAIENQETLSLLNCIFENNSVEEDSPFPFAGAVDNFEATIELIRNCTFINNTAEFGGAIFNDGAIKRIENSRFIGNSASEGGAIINVAGTLELIQDTTFNENNADIAGGAVFNFASTINSISRSTFSNNTAGTAGGAIINFLDNIESIVNSTFSGNSSETGGSLYNIEGIVNISFTTIAGNEAESGGGIFTDSENPGTVRVRNSIVAFNGASNCSGIAGQITDSEGNYSDDSSCGFTGDGAEIELGELDDNGGLTLTMELIDGDPLHSATPNCDVLDSEGIPTAESVEIDQRDRRRPSGPACDSGSFEAQPVSGGCSIAYTGNGSNLTTAFILLSVFFTGVIAFRRKIRV